MSKFTKIGIIGVGKVGESLSLEILRRIDRVKLLLHNRDPLEAIKVQREIEELSSFDRGLGDKTFGVTTHKRITELLQCSLIIICIKGDYNYADELKKLRSKIERIQRRSGQKVPKFGY